MIFTLWNILVFVPLLLLIGLIFYHRDNGYELPIIITLTICYGMFQFGLLYNVIPIKKYEEFYHYKNIIKTDDRIIFEFDDNTYKVKTDIRYFTADSIYIKKLYSINTYNDTTIKYLFYINKD